MKIVLIFLFTISFTSFSDEPMPETMPQKFVQKDHFGLRNNFGVGIGQTFLFKKYSEFGDDALSFDFYYSYKASHTFDLVVNAHFNEFSKISSNVRTSSVNTGIKARLYDFDSFAPYWILGAGFYFPKVKYVDTSGSEISPKVKSVFGLNAALGMDLKLNKRFTIGFASHFHFPFARSLPQNDKLSGAYLKLLIIPSISF